MRETEKTVIKNRLLIPAEKKVFITVTASRKDFMDREYLLRNLMRHGFISQNSSAFLGTSRFMAKLGEMNNVSAKDIPAAVFDSDIKINNLNGRQNDESTTADEENIENINLKKNRKERGDFLLGYATSSTFGLGHMVTGNEKIYEEAKSEGKGSPDDTIPDGIFIPGGTSLRESYIFDGRFDDQLEEYDEYEDEYPGDDEEYDEDYDQWYEENETVFNSITEAVQGGNIQANQNRGMDGQTIQQKSGQTPPKLPEDLSYSFKTCGRLLCDGGRIKLDYDESEIIGYKNSRIIFTFNKSNPDILILTKDSSVRTDFTLEEGVRHQCQATNGFMFMQVTASAYRMKNTLTKNGGTIDIGFIIETNGTPTDRIEMKINVRTQNK